MADDMTGQDPNKSISTSNSTSFLDEQEEGEKLRSSRSTTTANTTSGRAGQSPTSRRDKLQEDFQTWWSEARQREEPPSAFDFLVKMGLEEKLVQKMLWETLVKKCPLNPEKGMHAYSDYKDCDKDEDEEYWYLRKTRVYPGIIDYFCRSFFGCQGDDQNFSCMYYAPKHLPIFHSYAGLVEAAFVSRRQDGTWPSGILWPSEQDLLTLTKLACEAERYEGGEYCVGRKDVRHAVVHQCMRYKTYPVKFMLGLIEGFDFGDEFRSYEILGCPDDDRQPHYPVTNVRNAIDYDCLLGIKDIMDQGVETLELTEHFWTERAFRECLHLLPQTEYLGEVTLVVPERYVEDPTTPDQGAAFVSEMELDCYAGNNHKCGIDNLTLNFGRKKSWEAPVVNAFPGGRYALQSIFSMPDLQELVLELSAWPLANAAPYLMRAIQEKDKLEKLFITVNSHDSHSDALVMAMLGALKHNSSIQRFCYRASNRRSWSVDEAHVGPYKTQLLEILQHNTTLSHVELCHTKIEGKVKYLLGLNEHGRRLARDPKTKVVDFVARLSTSLEETLPTPEDEDLWERIYRFQWDGGSQISMERKRKNDNALGICYGLLRESPDSWCNHALHQPTPSKRRRLS